MRTESDGQTCEYCKSYCYVEPNSKLNYDLTDEIL